MQTSRSHVYQHWWKTGTNCQLQEKWWVCCTFQFEKWQKIAYGQIPPPPKTILQVQLPQFLHFCNECFQMRRNRTLDKHTFLSRSQKPTEYIQQSWNVLNGLPAKCDFGNQTEGLVYDLLVLNMSNKQVQEKLCTEPKDKLLETAIAVDFNSPLPSRLGSRDRERTVTVVKKWEKKTNLHNKRRQTQQRRVLEMWCW